MTKRCFPKVFTVSTAMRTKVHWLLIALVLLPLTLAYNCGGGGGDEVTSTSVSGRVTTSDGSPVPGIPVLATGPGCTGIFGGDTDASGNYRISSTDSLPTPTVDVIITPSGGGGYRFDPLERTATVSYGDHLTGYDFIATQLHSISGRITTTTGIGVPSVTVNLADGISFFATTTSDASGSYVFFNIAAGNYTITPTGLVFTPANRTVTVVDGTPLSGPTGQDFVL